MTEFKTRQIGFVEDLKKQWMAMIDAVSDSLAIVDEDYTVLRQNRSYSENAHASDLAITEFQGRKCYEVFAGRSSPCEQCLLKEAIVDNTEKEWQAADSISKGKSLIVRVHPLVLQNQEEHPAHGQSPNAGAADEQKKRFVVHYRDVTEFVALQDSLSHADKLAALGKLAGGVAHEINSPLAGILAFTQMVLKEMPSEDPHRDDLIEIEDAAKKCKVIVENLLGFARQDKPAEVFEFNTIDCLDSTLRLTRAVLRKANVEIIYERPNDIAQFRLRGRSGKLGQVFLNLITNAIEAMEEGGGTLKIIPEATPEWVKITFADNGSGMSPEVLKRIFDPFFTTKPIGKGTGLGLSISYSIVKQHGGKIHVQSVPGVGSSFCIELPKTADSAEFKTGEAS